LGDENDPRTLRVGNELEPRISPADEVAIGLDARLAQAFEQHEIVTSALARLDSDVQLVAEKIGAVTPGVDHRSRLRAIRHHLAALRAAVRSVLL
jgi:hypothetical protein